MANKNERVLSASLVSFISDAQISDQRTQGEVVAYVVRCEGSADVDKENLRWCLVEW